MLCKTIMCMYVFCLFLSFQLMGSIFDHLSSTGQRRIRSITVVRTEDSCVGMPMYDDRVVGSKFCRSTNVTSDPLVSSMRDVSISVQPSSTIDQISAATVIKSNGQCIYSIIPTNHPKFTGDNSIHFHSSLSQEEVKKYLSSTTFKLAHP